jgi:hypothetical protein
MRSCSILHTVYRTPKSFVCFLNASIIDIKPRRMRWAGHMARMGEVRGAYNILVGNLKGGDHSEDLGVDGRITLRWILGK